MQSVVPHVGHGGNVVDGDSQDSVLPIPPGQLDIVGGQADDRVMLLGQVSGELVGSLEGTTGIRHTEAETPLRPHAPQHGLPWKCLQVQTDNVRFEPLKMGK